MLKLDQIYHRVREHRERIFRLFLNQRNKRMTFAYLRWRNIHVKTEMICEQIKKEKLCALRASVVKDSSRRRIYGNRTNEGRFYGGVLLPGVLSRER